jgi:hypothetical protein
MLLTKFPNHRGRIGLQLPRGDRRLRTRLGEGAATTGIQFRSDQVRAMDLLALSESRVWPHPNCTCRMTVSTVAPTKGHEFLFEGIDIDWQLIGQNLTQLPGQVFRGTAIKPEMMKGPAPCDLKRFINPRVAMHDKSNHHCEMIPAARLRRSFRLSSRCFSSASHRSIVCSSRASL